MKASALARRAARYLPLVVSGALLTLIASEFEGWDLFARVDVGLLLLAFAVALFLDTTVGAFKWWRVALLSGIRASYLEIWKLWNGLSPVVFFTPFQSGHLLYALALRNAKGVRMVHAIECVAYDKALSLVGTLALIALGQLVLPADHPLSHGLILAGSAALVALYFADRLLFRLLARVRFFREHSRFFRHPVPLRHKLWLLPLAMLYQASDTVSMFLGCLALGVALPPEIVFGAFPVILLLTYAPVSISGFGVRESLIVFFLADSLTYDEAVSAGLLVDVLEYVAPALFGVVVLPHILRVLWKLRRLDSERTAPEHEGHAAAALAESSAEAAPGGPQPQAEKS